MESRIKSKNIFLNEAPGFDPGSTQVRCVRFNGLDSSDVWSRAGKVGQF